MRGLYDTGLEKYVLSTLMGSFDAAAYRSIEGELSVNDFYNPSNQEIFKAICNLAERDQPFDPVMVMTELEEIGQLEKAGGQDNLLDITQTIAGSTFNLVSYAKKVKALAKRRLIYNKLKKAQAELEMADSNIDDIWSTASSDINSVLSEESLKTSYDSLEAYDLWTSTLYEKSQQDGDAGVKTGFDDLDDKAVINSGDLVVIAARSGMGKTTLSQNIFARIAEKEDGVAVYFSIEMSVKDLTARIYSDKVDLHMKKAFTGKQLGDKDWDKIMLGAHIAPNLNFLIDDRSQISVGQMRSVLNRVKQDHGKVSAVFVDYMQLITPTNTNETRDRQVGMISGGLKSIAKDFNCPVFALSQLNRGLEKRPNKRPIMSDLRESGSIEQDASVILFIYRDEVYNPDSEHKGIAEIIIGKNRNGEVGTAIVGFDGAHSRFTNFVKRPEFNPFMESE